MWTVVQRNDPGAMDHLGRDDHISGTLKDVEVVVVDRRQIRRRVGPDDAPHRQRHIPIAFGKARVETRVGRGARGPELLPFRRKGNERRNSAVGRIHDEGRPFVLGDLQPARIHPVLVIGAVDVGVRTSIAPVTA